MRYIFLLVVLLSCAKEELKKDCNLFCFRMRILNDATPVQFFVNGEESFNQSNPICGLTDVCFCQPFNCDDEIKIQFQESAGIFYDLIVYNSDDEELATLNFEEVSSGVYQLTFIPSEQSPATCEKVYFQVVRKQVTIRGTATESGYTQPATSDIDWSLVADPPSVVFTVPSASGRTSEHLYRAIYPYAVGDTIELHTIIAWGAVPGAGGQVNIAASVHFLDVAFASISSTNILLLINQGNGSGTNEETNSLVVPSGAVYISIQSVVSQGAAGGNATITVSIPTFEDEGILDHFSDCIDLRNNHLCSKLIEYTNSDNFDDIVYEISPQPTFYLRVPAQLLEDENPQTQEDLELSNGTIVTVRQTIQEKSILKLGWMPPYMHTKVQKVLMHDTVIIDGIQWKRRDAYEAPRVEDYPLKKGEVLLTKYNSVLKNTI